MIKTESLRIGNWIKLIGAVDHQLVASLQFKIYDDVGTIHLYGNGIWNREDQVEGIEITDTILINIGFIPASRVWWEKEGFEIMFGWTESYGHFIHYTSDHTVLSPAYKYLHELQNVYYSLTGQELNYQP
jgi:hypothetical protein